MLQAINSPTLQCQFGAGPALPDADAVVTQRQLGPFANAAPLGFLGFELLCTDTSAGYAVPRNNTLVLEARAERQIGCQAPQVRTNTLPQLISPSLSILVSGCVGPMQLAATLRDMGPENAAEPQGNRLLEATLVNAANNNAPVGNTVFTLDVITDPAQGVPGSVLSNSYPNQFVPARQTRAITNTQGKAQATLYWLGSASPNQRLGVNCTAPDNCLATLTVRRNPDIVIGFFNGVANTEDAAQKSSDRLRREFGPQYKDSPLK